MPLMANQHGRIVAVSQSRVSSLMSEGFTLATDDEVAEWRARHVNVGEAETDPATSFSVPEDFEPALRELTKAELVMHGEDAYSLELDERDLKDELVAAILGAVSDTEQAILPD